MEAPYPFVVHALFASSELQLENCRCIEVGWVRATAMNKITHLVAPGQEERMGGVVGRQGTYAPLCSV